MIDEIQQMLEKGKSTKRPINGYVGDDSLNAYIRVTRRYIDNGMVNTLEIANVVVEEELQGRGIFKKFLKIIEALAKKYDRIVYIESVLNDVLLDKLPMYGYKKLENSDPPTFIKTP